MDARAASSEARSVARILDPRSVAVIGASRRTGTLGHAVFRRLVEAGFDGPVYPVNPEADHVGSVRAYPSVLDVPDEVDLAVVVVPADQVPEVVEECGRKRVRGLVVISAGFAEAGPAGAEEEDRLVDRVRSLGMRMVGPNTMGVINTAPGVRLHASFTEVMPAAGRIGGVVAVGHHRRRGARRAGPPRPRRLDLRGRRQQGRRQRQRPAPVLGAGRPHRRRPALPRVVRQPAELRPHRPAGRDPHADRGGEGRPGRAARRGARRGHAAAEVAVDALLAQTGVIRVDTLEQLVDAARVLADQPLPSGRRVAVLSNFWGPAVLAADACVAAGLELPTLSDGDRRALAAALRRGARLTQPARADLGGRARRSTARRWPRWSTIPRSTRSWCCTRRPSPIARATWPGPWPAAVSTHGATTVVASFLGPHEPGALDGLGRDPVVRVPRGRRDGARPGVPGTPSGARQPAGVGARARRRRRRGRGRGRWPPPRWTGHRRAARARPGGGAGAARHPRDRRGRAAAGRRRRTTRSRAAQEIGYPVALKAPGLARPAKTEAGGVAVDVHGDDELRRAFSRMAELHGDAMRPALVQAMARSGIDVELVVRQHPVFGSVLALGPAGTGQLEQRIVPLTDVDAERLLDGLARPRPRGRRLPRRPGAAPLGPRRRGARAGRGSASTRCSSRPAGAVPTDLHMRLQPWTRQSDPLVRRLL